MSDQRGTKFEKPKILLIDVPVEAEDALTQKGFNISAASFGLPYETDSKDVWQPVANNSGFPPLFGENEIVVVNLNPHQISEHLCDNEPPPRGEHLWFVRPINGRINPRPLVMYHTRANFDRILRHGGTFVVFADDRKSLSFMRQSDKAFFDFDNWGFLSLLSRDFLEITADYGAEIKLSNGVPLQSDLGHILSNYLKRGFYHCNFKLGPRRSELEAKALTINKFGQVVSVLVTSKRQKSAGSVFLLPQFEDKKQFLEELFSDFLPNTFPELFPELIGKRWVYRPPYELPEVTDLRRTIEQIEIEANKKKAAIEEEIERKQTAKAQLSDILLETDKELVRAVQKVLENLGFKSVKNIDEETASLSGQRREDLQVRDYTPALVIEVKGISGRPRDEDSLTVGKYVTLRMREEDRRDFQGLTIINHQRNLPGLKRDNKHVFGEVALTAADEQSIGLLTTWDLWRLERSFRENGWKHEDVKDLFYGVGRITPIPKHYTLLGSITAYWEKSPALGILLENGRLRVGDRIAFEFPIQFVEHDVESMQINSNPVDEAEAGQEVGISTHLKKEQARKGTRVFLIGSHTR